MEVTHQIILYRLNEDGSIPDFLCKSGDGIGGVFLKYDSNTAPPQDNIMLGLSEYPVTKETQGVVHIFTTKTEIVEYLEDVLADAVQKNPEDPQGDPIPVDVPTQVEWVWKTYQKKNNI